MKYKGLLSATVIFFFLVNTAYYWESKMGIYAMITFLLLGLYFVILTILFLTQVYSSVREKLRNRQRLVLIGVMVMVLGLTYAYPGGVIKFEKFESPGVLIARREGSANCTTVLKLREDHSFVEQNVCFGMSEIAGTYTIKQDTVFFENISSGRQAHVFYKFAIIKNTGAPNGPYLGELVRFKNDTDTIGIALWIIKNDLKP